ncbi:MAG: protein-glutamate O-methyltransferase CheR [Thermodesulfobacteriota bacterium]
MEDLEVRLLLEGIYNQTGYNFLDYAKASLKRRIRHFLAAEGLETVSRLQDKVLHDPGCRERFFLALSVQTTAMFRDPLFYLAIRREVVPLLKTYPFVRAWVAGCSTGEEAYSLAILLQEEDLTEKCLIYATDFNEPVLKKAQSGIFPLPAMKEYTANYLQAGGRDSFSSYYTAKYENAILRADLKKMICFGQHNLVTDASFNEFHLILCRNVMIYFNRELQNRVHRLLYDSLVTFGFLGLGDKESLALTPCADSYERLDPDRKLYRKINRG